MIYEIEDRKALVTIPFLKLGTTFDFEGNCTLKVIPGRDCTNCYFNEHPDYDCDDVVCIDREDGFLVEFVEV